MKLLQADKLALSLLAKVPRRAPNGRFLTVAMRKSLAAQLATNHLASLASKHISADLGKGEPAAGCEGGVSLMEAEPSHQQLDGTVEAGEVQQVKVEMATLQPDGAQGSPTEGGVQHSMPASELMVVLNSPRELSQNHAVPLGISSGNSAAPSHPVEEAQGLHRALRRAGRSTAGDVQIANGIHGPEVDLDGNAANSVNTPSIKGKRTHKGKPAAAFPKGPVWEDMEPSATHPSGHVPKASQPAG